MLITDAANRAKDVRDALRERAERAGVAILTDTPVRDVEKAGDGSLKALYCMGEDGAVGLIEPTPAAYTEKSRFEIRRGSYPTWTPPVVANGRLYLREQDNLYSYDIKR